MMKRAEWGSGNNTLITKDTHVSFRITLLDKNVLAISFMNPWRDHQW